MIFLTKLNIKNQSFGFTLVELVLVMALLAIISAGSFAGFNTYSKTLKLNSAAENLKTNLNEAKSSALSGYIYKCTSSQSLYGYKISINSSTTYSLYEVCEDNATGSKTNNQLTNKRFTLQDGVTFNPTGTNVTFIAVTGIPEGAATFILTNGSRSTSASVDVSGIIR